MRSVLTPWGLQEEKCVFWKVSVGLKCVRMSRILWVWNLLSQYWLEIETSFWFFPVPWGRQLSHRVKKFDWLIDQCLTLTFLDTRRWTSHPRRPRGSQSGWEKRRDESFQVRAKEPLGTDSHRTISKNSSRCRLLIGHKKCFVLLCPIDEQILLSSFREFVHDGYCPVRSPRLRVQRKLLFSTFLNRNEGTTDESKKRWDAISRSYSICLEKILFLTDHSVS